MATDLQRFIKVAEILTEEEAQLLDMILQDEATRQMASSMEAKRPWDKVAPKPIVE
jgi:FixJ family two-component response regulator